MSRRELISEAGLTQFVGSWSCVDETDEGVVFPVAFLVGDPFNDEERSLPDVLILLLLREDPLRRLMLGGITTSPDGC